MKKIVCLALVLCISLPLFACSKPEAHEASYNYGVDYEAYNEKPSLDPVEADEKSDADYGRKLIRTVIMKAETLKFDEVMNTIETEMKSRSGYYQDFTVDSRYSSSRSATLVLRIPKDKVDSFLKAISTELNVLRQEENVADVTLSYTDVASHLKVLRQEEERLIEMLAEAADLKDLLIIEDKLTSVRYEIERYESQLRTYDNQIDYATVRIYLAEVEKETQTERPSLGDRMGEGFSDSMKRLKESSEDFLVWLASSLPTLIILAAFALVIFLIVRRSVRKKAAARARIARAQQEKQED